VTFLLTNPYYLANWDAFRVERQAMASWFDPAFGLREFVLFVDNSLVTGLGVPLTAALIAVAAWRFALGGSLWARAASLGVFTPFLMIAGLSANMATWHINFRYVSYTLPLLLLFLAVFAGRHRTAILAVVLAGTIVQGTPLKLAYFDENDSRFSTRLRAAEWIDTHVPAGSGICVGTRTPTPYDVPPFQLGRYRINETPCEWTVLFERETDSLPERPGLELLERFRPRLSPMSFPLVFSHINPQISIYRRASN
jgi:hypothetical protein